jgi:TolA-binding protein/predicted  nucleic acid-binding Zn-ribbon protein
MKAPRTLLALSVGAALSSLGVARADDVDQLGRRALELDARVRELNIHLKPPADAAGTEIAERRLIDAQVLYELKNYDAASVILFDLVEKNPGSSAYPEALFYLADSLYLRRDYLSSRRYFEKIVAMGSHKARYQEALQRLIELSLHTGDYSPVDGYIAKLEEMPTAKQLPSVPYVKGKYFYFRRQFDRAIEAMHAIGPDHIYYFHALYFGGAAHVALGGEHLNDAEQIFSTILKTTAKTDSQKRIRELAHLALGRIYLDRGQLTASLAEYSEIGPRSDFFNDALYESAWVSIKGKDHLKAARALDLLLLNAPDSPLVPEVRLLIGGLRLRQNQFQPATESFARTRDEYEPLRRKFEDTLIKAGDAPAYFRALISKNLDNFDSTQVLPASSAKWLKSEPEVQRTSILIGDVGEIKRSLEGNRQLIERLEKAIVGPGRVNVFPELASARTKSVELTGELTEVKKKLATREAALIAPAAGDDSASLAALESERASLEQKLQQIPTKASSIDDRQKRARVEFDRLDKSAVEAQTVLLGVRAQLVATRKFFVDEVERRLPVAQQKAARAELESFLSQVERWQVDLEAVRKELDDATTLLGLDGADLQLAAQLKVQYNDVLRRLREIGVRVRARLSESDRRKAEQIESILERARTTEQQIVSFDARIDGILDARLKDLQVTLEEEKGHLANYQETLTSYSGESADVGGDIFADNFKKVAQRFYNIVVRADVGIIDVAWALKDSSTREINRLTAERKRELKLLDDEFREVLREQP